MFKSRITITISFILSTFYTYDNVVATLWNVVFFLGTLLDKRTVAEMRLEMPNELEKPHLVDKLCPWFISSSYLARYTMTMFAVWRYRWLDHGDI